jgi:hypothetical protein
MARGRDSIRDGKPSMDKKLDRSRTISATIGLLILLNSLKIVSSDSFEEAYIIRRKFYNRWSRII